MSQHSSQRDPFKFALQEEKFQNLKKLSNNYSVINNMIGISEIKDREMEMEMSKSNLDKTENNFMDNASQYVRAKNNYNNHTQENQNQHNQYPNIYNSNLNILNQSNLHSPDLNNEFLKSLLDKFKNEIYSLKSYINRLNKEIRKNFNMEIPLLEDQIFSGAGDINFNSIGSILSSRQSDFENLIKFFHESIHRLINPEYLNPIFNIYDNHILNLENEVKHYKNLSLKYENKVSELIKENDQLRQNILIKSNEMKDLLKLKVDSNCTVSFDEEFIRALEDRNNLLSKENEILALNLQQANKELFDFSLNYAEKHKENLEKIQLYDKLEEELGNVNRALDNLILKNQISENKIIELAEFISKLEIEKENFKLESEKYRTENHSLNEANQFYKNYIQKINAS